MTEKEFEDCEQLERQKHDDKVKELEEENVELIGKVAFLENDLNNAKAQIEKMKCCSNCKWSDSESKLVHPPCKDCNWDFDKWEIKEK